MAASSHLNFELIICVNLSMCVDKLEKKLCKLLYINIYRSGEKNIRKVYMSKYNILHIIHISRYSVSHVY